MKLRITETNEYIVEVDENRLGEEDRGDVIVLNEEQIEALKKIVDRIYLNRTSRAGEEVIMTK